MDTLSKQQRHKNMAAIKAKDTKPEIIVRKYLWNNGFRYRFNHSRLPGHPDIVLRKYRTCIFVNGCFWHGHDNCKFNKIPKTNTEYWINKLEKNKKRDTEEQKKLALMGWHCIVVWECELKNNNKEKTLNSIAYTLNKLFLMNYSVQYELQDDEIQGVAEDIIKK